MNRTLTAAVALAAGLGMAGLAQAQSSAGRATTPSTVSPSTPSSQMTPPMSSQTPNAMQNPGAMSTPNASANAQGTPGVTPQDQIDQGQQQGAGASLAQVEQAQQQLKSQGLYNGAIDGIVGPGTQSALMQFQRSQGLPETAQLDQQTLGRLTNGQNAGANAGTRQNIGRASAGAAYPEGTQNPAASGNR